MSIVRTRRPPIGIPKSKRGLIRMEQANFKTIVEMAYEMDLAEYFKKILDIDLLIHNNKSRYYPTENMWRALYKVKTLYKLFTIKEEETNNLKVTYLKSNRVNYRILIGELFELGDRSTVIDFFWESFKE
jgi:hypothetical protein